MAQNPTDPLLKLLGGGKQTKKKGKKELGGTPPPSRPIKTKISQHWMLVLDDNIKQYPKVRKSGSKRGKNKAFVIRQCLNDLKMTEEDFVKMVAEWD